MNALNEVLSGHNSSAVQVNIEARLFNSISRYAGEEGCSCTLSFPAGSDISDVLTYFNIPRHKVFLVYVNGRDITAGLPHMGGVRTTYVLEDGDVVALSGPVPYSYGYGSPIV